MEGTKSPLAALLSAMMMDAEHRDAERDELLAAIQKLDPPEANRKLIVKLAALVQAALANEPERRLDLEAVEGLVRSADFDTGNEMYLVVAQYFENRGDRKQAIEYYRRCAEVAGWKFPKFGAAVRLNELERMEAN